MELWIVMPLWIVPSSSVFKNIVCLGLLAPQVAKVLLQCPGAPKRRNLKLKGPASGQCDRSQSCPFYCCGIIVTDAYGNNLANWSCRSFKLYGGANHLCVGRRQTQTWFSDVSPTFAGHVLPPKRCVPWLNLAWEQPCHVVSVMYCHKTAFRLPLSHGLTILQLVVRIMCLFHFFEKWYGS